MSAPCTPHGSLQPQCAHPTACAAGACTAARIAASAAACSWRRLSSEAAPAPEAGGGAAAAAATTTPRRRCWELRCTLHAAWKAQLALAAAIACGAVDCCRCRALVGRHASPEQRCRRRSVDGCAAGRSQGPTLPMPCCAVVLRSHHDREYGRPRLSRLLAAVTSHWCCSGGCTQRFRLGRRSTRACGSRRSQL